MLYENAKVGYDIGVSNEPRAHNGLERGKTYGDDEVQSTRAECATSSRENRRAECGRRYVNGLRTKNVALDTGRIAPVRRRMK